jgi:hypothetical protein
MRGTAKRARPGTVEVQDGPVRMTAHRGMRLRHVSDTPGPMGLTFGGDTMGHWNVDRINRLLDAFHAPVVRMPLPRENMIGMARVGAPDAAIVSRYASKPLATMPPLSFVAFGVEDAGELGIATLLVDGHHRMAALALMNATAVPARVLPPTLADDVRIVEMGEFATFPEPDMSGFKKVHHAGAAR